MASRVPIGRRAWLSPEHSVADAAPVEVLLLREENAALRRQLRRMGQERQRRQLVAFSLGLITLPMLIPALFGIAQTLAAAILP